MRIIDLSLLKEEDFTIKTVTGEEYHIDGNFSTEFFLTLYDAYQTVQDTVKSDVRAATELMKDIVVKILSLDPDKNVTRETLREQKIDNFVMLQAILTSTMQQANERANNPSSESPTSN